MGGVDKDGELREYYDAWFPSNFIKAILPLPWKRIIKATMCE
jgi:hypothetical protein